MRIVELLNEESGHSIWRAPAHARACGAQAHSDAARPLSDDREDTQNTPGNQAERAGTDAAERDATEFALWTCSASTTGGSVFKRVAKQQHQPQQQCDAKSADGLMLISSLLTDPQFKHAIKLGGHPFLPLPARAEQTAEDSVCPKVEPTVSPVPSVIPSRCKRKSPEVSAPTAHDAKMAEQVSTVQAKSTPCARRSSRSEKLLKQRLNYRRTYHEKKETLTELRAQVTSLEARFKAAMREYKQSARRGDARQQDSVATFREGYVDLMEMKERLWNERERLQHEVQEMSKVRDKLRWLVDAEGGLSRQEHDEVMEGNASVLPDECLGVEPLPQKECAALVTEWVRQIHQADDLATHPDLCCFGWDCLTSDTRSLTRRCVFRRKLPNTNADALMTTTWETFTAPLACKQLISPFSDVEFHLVQRINADAQLLFRTVRGTDDPLQGGIVCARVATPGGFLVLCHSLDQRATVPAAQRASIHALLHDAPERAQNLFVWADIRRDGASSCVVEMGRMLDSGSDSGAVDVNADTARDSIESARSLSSAWPCPELLAHAAACCRWAVALGVSSALRPAASPIKRQE